MTKILRFVAVAAVAAFVLFSAVKVFGGGSSHTLVADFPRTVSIYEGSEVRVLGVVVGTVDKVEPKGTSVSVTMHYDHDIKVPADARAAIVAPSVVGDRFIQLDPVWTSGPTLPDNAKLGLDRTATPLELDQIYGDIDTLVTAIGPRGANKHGALSDLIDQTAANFKGEGAQFNETITNYAGLSKTLDDSKEELFGSAQKLEGFISTLAQNDGTVRKFNTSLASISDVLAGEREDLASALRNLAAALGDVRTFVTDNKSILSTDLKSLNKLAKTVVKRRDELTETLHNAPQALDNLYYTYNPSTGTTDTQGNFDKLIQNSVSDLPVTACTVLNNVDPTGQLCSALGRSGNVFGVMAGTGSTIGRHSDLTLGGLVR